MKFASLDMDEQDAALSALLKDVRACTDLHFDRSTSVCMVLLDTTDSAIFAGSVDQDRRIEMLFRAAKRIEIAAAKLMGESN